MTARLGRSVTPLTKHGRGALHAANPPSNKTPPMRILGSTTLPLKFPAETRVRKIMFRAVDGLPYGLIVGADYLRNEESILDSGPGKGFKHNPNAAWIPFLDHTPPSALIASLTDSLAMTAVDAPHRTSQSHEDMAWEDDSTLEWDVYLNNGDTSTEGYASKVVADAPRQTTSNNTTQRSLRLRKNRNGRRREGASGGNHAPRSYANWLIEVTNRQRYRIRPRSRT